MKTPSKYISKPIDDEGYIEWSTVENSTWNLLYNVQMERLPGLACETYMEGLNLLDIRADKIPQIPEINKHLEKLTGWNVEPVPCLIPFSQFFKLLANKKFPCATFIRTPEDLLYIKEPDIFHEVFGHCPMLTDPHFAEFTERYGKLGLAASPKERIYLARLYWFTAEFGLMKNEDKWEAYGGGVMSSPSEADHCMSDVPERKSLTILDAMRTPYRIDIVQPIYFYIQDFKNLANFDEEEILSNMRKAMELGLFEPTYETT